MNDHRRNVRAPLLLAVSYRTSGAFLVAYSVNLSKGGVFIEAEPLPVGTAVHLVVEVPDVGTLDVDGVVTWVRERAETGRPRGMGIRFAGSLDTKHGRAIDDLVATFEGLEVMLVGSPDKRALLKRYVASMLTCDVVEADTTESAAVALADRIDLAIVDLASSGGAGIQIVRMACAGETPLIALAADETAAKWARQVGAHEVVRDPPSFGELQRAVLAALSRPTAR